MNNSTYGATGGDRSHWFCSILVFLPFPVLAGDSTVMLASGSFRAASQLRRTRRFVNAGIQTDLSHAFYPVHGLPEQQSACEPSMQTGVLMGLV